jgi:hypothetical protein
MPILVEQDIELPARRQIARNDQRVFGVVADCSRELVVTSGAICCRTSNCFRSSCANSRGWSGRCVAQVLRDQTDADPAAGNARPGHRAMRAT